MTRGMRPLGFTLSVHLEFSTSVRWQKERERGNSKLQAALRHWHQAIRLSRLTPGIEAPMERFCPSMTKTGKMKSSGLNGTPAPCGGKNRRGARRIRRRG